MNSRHRASCSIDSSDENGVVDAPVNVATTHEIEATDKYYQEGVTTSENMFGKYTQLSGNAASESSVIIQNQVRLSTNSEEMITDTATALNATEMQEFNRFDHSTSPFLDGTHHPQVITFEVNSPFVTLDKYGFQTNEEDEDQIDDNDSELNGEQLYGVSSCTENRSEDERGNNTESEVSNLYRICTFIN